MNTTPPYGQGNATFLAAGGEPGLKKLAHDFYQIVATSPETVALKNMHSEGFDLSADKLYRFLCGWMGGPKRYSERYGPMGILRSHNHLAISRKHGEQWLWAMRQAIAKQDYPNDLSEYLSQQLKIPVERIIASHQSRSHGTQ